VSCSLKTESKRLANIKKKNIQIFFVATDPLKMTGYLRIGIFIQLNKNFHHKTLRIIQETLERNLVVALPMMYYRDLVDYQIITPNIFEIIQTIEDSFIDEVKSVELFLPHKAMIKRDWILSELDKNIYISLLR
jgi:hypothetical protein